MAGVYSGPGDLLKGGGDPLGAISEALDGADDARGQPHGAGGSFAAGAASLKLTTQTQGLPSHGARSPV